MAAASAALRGTPRSQRRGDVFWLSGVTIGWPMRRFQAALRRCSAASPGDGRSPAHGGVVSFDALRPAVAAEPLGRGSPCSRSRVPAADARRAHAETLSRFSMRGARITAAG